MKTKKCRQCGKEVIPHILHRHNVERQEEVVEALWQFAANLQLRPDKGGSVAKLASGPDAGTKCGSDHVGSALEKIMRAFHYEVVPVQ